MSDFKKVIKAFLPLIGSVIVCSLAMLGVLHFFGKMNAPEIYGTILGTSSSLFCFLYIQLTVQRAQQMKDQVAISTMMQRSSTIRLVVWALTAFAGASFSFLSQWTTLLPLLFPTICMAALRVVVPTWKKIFRAYQKTETTEK